MKIEASQGRSGEITLVMIILPFEDNKPSP
jgi:hypothetical protein